jgi:cellulose synthase/poly-beta-1,6-N-acetylglucosamine synthase-like glycosyltransferase
MNMELSSLRIVGLMIGIVGLYVTFAIYRGPRWKRKNFIISGLFSLGLVLVSVNPGVLNLIANILQLKMEQRGRILALLIGSNIMLWFLFVYYKTRLDEYRYQFDLLIRKLGHEATEDLLKKEIADKAIMVIIPAYNEAENLKELLKKIPDRIKEKKVGVLVVDDGSSDNTRGVVIQSGHLVVQNKINRGQGAASRLGYDVLLKNDIQVGVTMDADNQHLPEEIEKLVTPVLNDEYDLVIGSRILGESFKSSLMRDTGINLFTKVINVVIGTRLTDCSSGFRAFNVNKMSSLNLREDQFQTAEVIVEAAKKNLRIGEVPITIIKRKHGTSKKGRDIKYGLFFAKTILKSWWR